MGWMFWKQIKPCIAIWLTLTPTKTDVFLKHLRPGHLRIGHLLLAAEELILIFSQMIYSINISQKLSKTVFFQDWFLNYRICHLFLIFQAVSLLDSETGILWDAVKIWIYSTSNWYFSRPISEVHIFLCEIFHPEHN